MLDIWVVVLIAINTGLLLIIMAISLARLITGVRLVRRLDRIGI